MTYHKKHLPSIFVGQDKKTKNCGHWNLVIEGFTMELEECLEYFDVITTTWCETLNFSEDGNGVARHINNAGLLHNLLMERINRVISTCYFRTRNVETHLNQIDRSIIVLKNKNLHRIYLNLTLKQNKNFRVEKDSLPGGTQW